MKFLDFKNALGIVCVVFGVFGTSAFLHGMEPKKQEKCEIITTEQQLPYSRCATYFANIGHDKQKLASRISALGFCLLAAGSTYLADASTAEKGALLAVGGLYYAYKQNELKQSPSYNATLPITDPPLALRTAMRVARQAHEERLQESARGNTAAINVEHWISAYQSPCPYWLLSDRADLFTMDRLDYPQAFDAFTDHIADGVVSAVDRVKGRSVEIVSVNSGDLFPELEVLGKVLEKNPTALIVTHLINKQYENLSKDGMSKDATNTLWAEHSVRHKQMVRWLRSQYPRADIAQRLHATTQDYRQCQQQKHLPIPDVIFARSDALTENDPIGKSYRDLCAWAFLYNDEIHNGMLCLDYKGKPVLQQVHSHSKSLIQRR